MNIRRLFVARANSSVPGTPTHLEAAPVPESPVFLTAQSLASFPGAALAINILWHLVAVINKDVAKLAAIPITIAFLVGTVIYLIGISGNMSRKDKVVGFVVAFINSAWLGLNALGISIVNPPSFGPK
jgi:hypothetical protein